MDLGVANLRPLPHPGRGKHHLSHIEHGRIPRPLPSSGVVRVRYQGGPPDAGAQVFDDDKAFHEAVGKYKQVVTHYFQCRAQTRVSSLSAPVRGLIDWKTSTEWAKGRGAAHVHMLILEES
jgi:hypothetical protein